jgi:hypothetical protein
MKAYDGTMHWLVGENCLILKNAKGDPISVKAFAANAISTVGKTFCLGAKVKFSQHSVRVGICMSSPEVHIASAVSVDHFEESIVQDSDSAVVLTVQQHPDIPLKSDSGDTEFSSAVFDSLSLGFNFSAGLNFAKSISKKYLSTVHSSRDTAHFTMVVSFGRTSFHLTEDSVGFALEAAIGGYCGYLKVSFFSEKEFSPLWFQVNRSDLKFSI